VGQVVSAALFACGCPFSLELVDLCSGEICDRESNGWLLDEALQAMEQIEHPLVREFTRSLRRYQDQLLTFLDWAAEMLLPFQRMLEAHIPDPVQRQHFMCTVAWCWRLRQAFWVGY
jgi:hypothetical protein